MTRNTARALVWGAIVIAALLSQSVAAAQDYPLHDGPLELDSTHVMPGDVVLVTGDGFQPGGQVTITLGDSKVLATTEADENGAISIEVTVPADTAGGEHEIQASGPAPDNGVLILASTLETASGQPTLGQSGGGGGMSPLLLIGGIAVVVVAVLGLVVARIRAQQ